MAYLVWCDLPVGPSQMSPLSFLSRCQLLTGWHHFDHKSSLSRTFSKFADTIKSTSSASSGRFLLKKPSCNIQEWALSIFWWVNLCQDENDGEEKKDSTESGHQVDPPEIKSVLKTPCAIVIIRRQSDIENRRDQLGAATGSSWRSGRAIVIIAS